MLFVGLLVRSWAINPQHNFIFRDISKSLLVFSGSLWPPVVS